MAAVQVASMDIAHFMASADPEMPTKMAMSTQTELTMPASEMVPFKMPQFDPEIHLNYQPPKVRHSFTELGLPKPQNAPDVCFTEPFQLFSDEGVRMMRRELFQKEFLDKYMRSWARAPCYIGGHTNTEGVSLYTLSSAR